MSAVSSDAGRNSENIERLDVIIVGAGISGIGSATLLRKHCPDLSFVVLDAMESFGGTWLMHKYPGTRSDSDLFTFGYGVAPHLISVTEADVPVRQTRHGPRKVSIGAMNKMLKRGSLKIGENFVGPVVMHPGHAAKPFLRPALDQKAEEAVDSG